MLMSVNDLTVGYGKTVVVQGLELSIVPGEIITLIGANGEGKSTILKTIANQLSPISGTVLYHDKSKISERELSKILAVSLTNRIDPELMTCEDVVNSGRFPYTGRLGILSANDKEKVTEAMELTHVSELRERPFTDISDGQRQRVMLARAVCQEPEILILDEPTSFLDMKHKLELLNLIRKLAHERNISIIMSLHELELAERISDRLICIKDKKTDRIGTPEEVFNAEYIRKLYNIDCGSYDPATGAELPAIEGEPEVFVIGGGGDGIQLYRQLQRKGIPFAVGVIHENDIEYPVASVLAAEIITEKAFESVSDEKISNAIIVMDKCSKVICVCNRFGAMNEGNRKLLAHAEDTGKIVSNLEV